jgi:hypothetical protein
MSMENLGEYPEMIEKEFVTDESDMHFGYPKDPNRVQNAHDKLVEEVYGDSDDGKTNEAREHISITGLDREIKEELSKESGENLYVEGAAQKLEQEKRMRQAGIKPYPEKKE